MSYKKTWEGQQEFKENFDNAKTELVRLLEAPNNQGKAEVNKVVSALNALNRDMMGARLTTEPTMKTIISKLNKIRV